MRVLLDAGPIVALLSPRDAWHAWARETFERIGVATLLTCEPVLAEASLLLRMRPDAAAGVLELVTRRFVRVPFRVETEAGALHALMTRYRSVPMSLADACLVRMSELDGRARVMTLDGDFRVYRRAGRGIIPLLTPG